MKYAVEMGSGVIMMYIPSFMKIAKTLSLLTGRGGP
jgi:hypothetical protein